MVEHDYCVVIMIFLVFFCLFIHYLISDLLATLKN